MRVLWQNRQAQAKGNGRFLPITNLHRAIMGVDDKQVTIYDWALV
ncbi:MAG: hypothetical protein WAS33_17495 [Candidatus Promineifilaceae bacterium]